ncbi:hypothetical protein [Maribacter cobaltidurans]|jgi:hypothetical protein|uniref:Uncharacterized protein n=1 Tax=Maribacter cobaltidurans TaxID=1178778 RepID=A0A223V3I3_9FLAO|nr:hypothetical protein [Maribacter cobaltidurans]ASV29964.1 hypothetical protein CJ263_06860 [Maribacter cobaltidurans]GGD88339.1 hypothetical protein GCM10011412_27740 [Maribacter cobaltidurans]
MEISNNKKWYHYVAAFFAGMFLANAIPHLINGISGDPFPTPFADPPGKGLSAPWVNVLWSFFNIIVGYFLFQYAKITIKNKLSLIIFIIGALVISIVLSIVFLDKVKL